MTVSATNATLNGKQVRTGDSAVAVKLVGANVMRVVIRASCRIANGAKLGFFFVAIIIAVVAAHYYCCVVVVVVEEM